MDPTSFTTPGDEIIIEEKRRRMKGQEGYTIHKYRRGKMLGKGGFAKVYQCTALDTGKDYAVKIVPKANLVKARARQKVSNASEKVSCLYQSLANFTFALDCYSSKLRSRFIGR